MASTGGTNFEKLLAAGVIDSTELPPEHASVIDGLTKWEVEVIVAVTRRLKAADVFAGHPPAQPGEQPHYLSLVKF
jgi:hypothetical protein